jgi:hypothetical protein
MAIAYLDLAIECTARPAFAQSALIRQLAMCALPFFEIFSLPFRRLHLLYHVQYNISIRHLD